MANIEKKAKHIQTEGQKKKAKTEKEHKLNVQKHQSKLVSLDPHIKKWHKRVRANKGDVILEISTEVVFPWYIFFSLTLQPS